MLCTPNTVNIRIEALSNKRCTSDNLKYCAKVYWIQIYNVWLI